MSEDIQRRIREKISEIEEKSASGNYIYRGEPKTHDEHPFYGKVSSNLWRKIVKELSKKKVDIEIINTQFVQRGMLFSVTNYANETIGEDDFATMGKLQHYGGKTNLIDFTTDYLRALFFACDGSPDEDGRVILLRRNGDIDEKYQIKEPQNPINRVIAQNSIFVQPPEGYIKSQDICCSITIPKDLKQRMLHRLRQYHNISTETIYNDLHGFITHQNIHQGAYIDYYIGLSHQFKECFRKATTYFDKAIEQNPHFAEAYYYRGSAYLNLGRDDRHKYKCAIKDLKEAIRLNPNYEEAYNVRGLVYHHMGEYGCAIKDLKEAIRLNPNYADAYNNRGVVYRDKGEYDRAIGDFNRAIKLKPDYADAYCHRGSAYYKKREFAKAIVDLDKTIAINPKNQRARDLCDKAQRELKNLNKK